MKICSYCGSEKYYAKGFCKNCYERNRHHGTPARHKDRNNTIKVGDRFNRLEIVEALGGGMYRCKCICGKFTTAGSYTLKRGETKSCGCYREEIHRKYFEFLPRTKRQKEVYDLFKKGMSYKQIGSELGISKQAVGDILKACAVVSSQKAAAENPARVPRA
ncbi:MAG: hypothetical protein FWD39_06165 [Clostridiales bacterium]|nr:hypothetical protein [Clostridiales bacterium]